MVGAWVRLLVNSAVVACVCVAAQLGAGDALGIIAWDGPHDAATWRALLTWLAFSYAVAVLAGAIVGHGSARFATAAQESAQSERDRSSRASRRRQGTGQGAASRVVASVLAAGGAAAAIGLAWLPARDVTPPMNVDPGLVVSLTAGAGVVVGLVLALVSLAARPVGAGLAATVAWLWLVAIAAAVAGLAQGAPYAAPRLGVPDAPSLLVATEWTGPRVMIIMAVLVGATVAGVARWRGAARLGAALAGFGGPAVVASAYLVAGAGERGGPQYEPYFAALLATGAGLVASVLVAMPGRRAPRPAPAAQPPTQSTVEGDVIEVVRVPTSPVSGSGRPRPSWAEGSGPYARAYSGAGQSAEDGAVPVVGTASVVARQPVTVMARGTGWDGDTVATATAGGRHAQTAASSAESYRVPIERRSGVARHAAPD